MHEVKDWCRHRYLKTDTLWETNSTRQRSVTHVNSETKKTRTCTSGRWLKLSYCFVGNYQTHCSLAQSVYLSHTHSQRQQHLSASVQLSQTKTLALFFNVLLASPLLHRFSLCLPMLPPFFASVFHLFCPLASPLPLNHILLLSFHTLAHTLQHNGYWSDM